MGDTVLCLPLPGIMAIGPLGAVLNGVKSHATSLTNTASIFLVIGVELLVSNNLFKCPCHPNDQKVLTNPDIHTNLPVPQDRVYYSVSYFVWPAVASFVMALSISGATLRCLTGYKRHCQIVRHCKAMRYLLANSGTAFVPPVAWLVVAFMDGRYYECALSRLPTNCLPDVKTLTNTTNYNILVHENEHHRSISQIIGLTCLGGGITLAALFVLCGQLCTNLTFYQRRYMQMFREKEMETFSCVSEEMITSELTEKWKKFFRTAHSDDWCSISGLPEGGPVYSRGVEYYSDFHKWEPSKEPLPPCSGGVVNPVFSVEHKVPPADGDTKADLELKPVVSHQQQPKETDATPSGDIRHLQLPRHLVGLPVNNAENGGGVIYEGQLATLFVPVSQERCDGDQYVKGFIEGGLLDKTDRTTQTEKKENKKVAFSVNTGFEHVDDDASLAKILRVAPPVSVKQQQQPSMSQKTHAAPLPPPLPQIEVSDMYT